MVYTPSTSRVAIATIFATTTSEMLVRPCSDVSSAAGLRGAGARLGIVLAVVVLSVSDVLTISVSLRWCLPDSPVAVVLSVLDISSSSGPMKDSWIGVPMRSMCDRNEDERTCNESGGGPTRRHRHRPRPPLIHHRPP